MKKKIYAVKNGRATGIFKEWQKCSEHTNRYPNAKFLGFEYWSELEEDPKDVPGSLRHAIKEAEEFLGDLVYLGESADYLEDRTWKKRGFLPFGDKSEADNPEFSSSQIEEDEEDIEEDEEDIEEDEEDIEDDDEKYGKWLADNNDSADIPIGYWKTAEEMSECVNIIRESKQDDVKKTASEKLKVYLERCSRDVNLCKLTAIYKDKEEKNAIGYNPPAVNDFVKQMQRAYPKPELSEIEAVEEDVPLWRIFEQTGALKTELIGPIRGQEAAIEKLCEAYFSTELNLSMRPHRRGPRNVYLLAGPPGVGKTLMAQQFAFRVGLHFQRFNMSEYTFHEITEELIGYGADWKHPKPGKLTEFVAKYPKCVLLFDEIEKAHITIIRLFLQILDDGICEDKFYERNVSFKNAVIFFTTNAGKQLYSDARNENLTLLPDKVVIDALEKDEDPQTKQHYFPPEILSRMSSYTIIMMNHLKADAILELVKEHIEVYFKRLMKKHGYVMGQGKEELARTVLYSIGGSADARNASEIAGKLISREINKFLELLKERKILDENDEGRRIEWKCDFESEEISDLYKGERNCVIPVFGTIKYEPTGRIKYNDVRVENTVDVNEFMKMIYKENVLFAVIDYIHGLENMENVLNVVDVRTVGRDVFLRLQEEAEEIPVYILNGSHGHEYTYKEKSALMKKGAVGFIESICFKRQLEQAYMDVCCQMVMETLASRHQVLTYETRQEFDKETNVGSIIFCDFKLETAVESEDKFSVLSDAERPHIKFSDVIGAERAKEELQYFVKYLQKPREFYMKGGRPPKGILLYGRPGTGKTMLARAMAGESDVLFFPISATDFKNGLAGGSEAMIRQKFETARKYAPAIIFIDEIDAIGKKRTGSVNTHLTESMLNALLTEMDGFMGTDSKKPVFVLAATNYGVGGQDDGIDSLDDALLRRFDNRIYVDLPNENEREQYILNMIADKNITTVSKEAAHNIAVRTKDQSLADLQNVFELAFRNAAKQLKTMTDDDLLIALKEYISIPSDAERPTTKFSDVIGAENAKEELQYFVKYLTEPSEFLEKGGRPPKGILLYGPPGTGKTMLAKAMAGESEVTFFPTSATEFMDSLVGGSEAKIRQTFEMARKHAPAIIFIDEIDAIGKKRTGSHNTHYTESMLNALLTEMDGFRSTDSNKPVFVLAATNYVVRGESGESASLDDALLRRFDNKIYVDLPKESEREQYILRMLAGRNITTVSKEAAHSIAERTTGKSLADLQNVIEHAFRNAVRHSGTMTDDDLLTALEEQNHGEKKEHTPDYYRSVAIHETGHAYVYYISGDKPSYITIESRGNFLGYMQHANQEDVESYTRDELLAKIRTSLAGRAAEQVFYGKEKSLNTGASSDLQHATDVAFQIVCKYGMEDDQLITLNKDEVLQSALAGQYTAKVNEILKTEMKNTIEIIENAKDKIRRIADVLVKENRLTGKRFEELMEADG